MTTPPQGSSGRETDPPDARDAADPRPSTDAGPPAGQRPPATAGSPADASTPGDLDGPTPEQFLAVQRSEEFIGLRRAFRGFAMPMTVTFLVWYLAYVLLSTYAEGFMSIQVFGTLNIGILLGLSQFLMTFLITWLYIRHANRSLDPVSSRIRDELEGAH